MSISIPVVYILKYFHIRIIGSLILGFLRKYYKL
jgi:hypothetical protein